MKCQSDPGRGCHMHSFHGSHLYCSVGRRGGEADTQLSTPGWAAKRMGCAGRPPRWVWMGHTSSTHSPWGHPRTIPWEHSAGEEPNTWQSVKHPRQGAAAQPECQAASQRPRPSTVLFLPTEEEQRGLCSCSLRQEQPRLQGTTQRTAQWGAVDPSRVPRLCGSSARQEQP